MNPSTETLLVLLIFALYLKDCLLLLQPGEAVLLSRRGTRWAAGFGLRNWRLGGREPYLANPLRPDLVVFRLCWSPRPRPQPGPPPRVPVGVPVELARLGPLAWASWCLLLVLVPMALVGHLGPVVVVAAIVLAYASILVALLCAWAWRRPLGIAPRSLALLAFECLACPPCAPNLLRRIATLRAVDEDFEAAAQRLLDPGPLARARAQCRIRIDERLEEVGEGDPEGEVLRQARRRFQETGHEPD